MSLPKRFILLDSTDSEYYFRSTNNINDYFVSWSYSSDVEESGSTTIEVSVVKRRLNEGRWKIKEVLEQ